MTATFITATGKGNLYSREKHFCQTAINSMTRQMSKCNFHVTTLVHSFACDCMYTRTRILHARTHPFWANPDQQNHPSRPEPPQYFHIATCERDIRLQISHRRQRARCPSNGLFWQCAASRRTVCMKSMRQHDVMHTFIWIQPQHFTIIPRGGRRTPLPMSRFTGRKRTYLYCPANDKGSDACFSIRS